MSLVVSWWYSRKVHIQVPPLTASEVGREAGELLKLGLGVRRDRLHDGPASRMPSELCCSRNVGFEATGYYQSAWTLGGLLRRIHSSGHGSGLYPRLTASAHDNPLCNRLVNEQTRWGFC